MPQKGNSSASEPRTKKHRTGIPDQGNRCNHTDALGRQCRSLALRSAESRGGTKGLCFKHGTEERQLRDAEEIAEELLSATPPLLNTTIAVNRVMGKLFELTARNRLPIRHASTLAYIGSMLLNSCEGVKHEVIRVEGEPMWAGMAKRAVEALRAYGKKPPEEEVVTPL